MKPYMLSFFQKLIALLFFLLMSNSVQSQTSDWIWARAANGNSNDEGLKVTTDQNGNVYATGRFFSDPLIFGSDTLHKSGSWDIFLVKYDPFGNVLWAQSAGGTQGDEAYDLATDYNNNLVVTGGFSSDTMNIGGVALTNAGSANLFLAKFDENGTLLWAKSSEGDTLNTSIAGYAVYADPSGNILLTGKYIGNIFIDNDTLPTGNNYEMFVAKFNSSGNLVWARNSGSTGGQVNGDDVLSDNSGNVYITGWFQGSTVNFGNIVLNNLGNGSDMFLVKYDSSGNALWATNQNGGGDWWENGNSIIADNNNNIYVTGYFQSSSITFGNFTLTNANFNQHLTDIYIVKYNSSGNVIWAKREGAVNTNPAGDYPYNLSTDGWNFFYLTGLFGASSIVFGQDTVMDYGNGGGFYIVKYDFSGNVIWAKGSDGCDGMQTGYGVAADLNNNVYLTGNYGGTYLILGNDTLPNSGGNNIFVARISPDSLNSLPDLYSTDFTFQVFPNPCTNELNINSNMDGLSEITLFDVTSRKILQQKLTGSVSINTGKFANGVYIYKIEKNGIIQQGKILKE